MTIKQSIAQRIRVEAERRWKANDIPVEEYVGWKDAAAWLDGTEEVEE